MINRFTQKIFLTAALMGVATTQTFAQQADGFIQSPAPIPPATQCPTGGFLDSTHHLTGILLETQGQHGTSYALAHRSHGRDSVRIDLTRYDHLPSEFIGRSMEVGGFYYYQRNANGQVKQNFCVVALQPLDQYTYEGSVIQLFGPGGETTGIGLDYSLTHGEHSILQLSFQNTDTRRNPFWLFDHYVTVTGNYTLATGALYQNTLIFNVTHYQVLGTPPVQPVPPPANNDVLISREAMTESAADLFCQSEGLYLADIDPFTFDLDLLSGPNNVEYFWVNSYGDFYPDQDKCTRLEVTLGSINPISDHCYKTGRAVCTSL